MGTGQRQTHYFKDLNAIKEVAKEENIEVNGSTFEELFWDRYVGADETYKSKLKALYRGEQTLKETIMNILDTMAYTPKYMVKDNIEFIKVVRDAVGTADWFDPKDNNTDYSLKNRETIVKNIANILGVIVRELEHRSNMVKEPSFISLKPWEIAVQDERYSKILNDESNYSEVKIAEFTKKEPKLREAFNNASTPGKALDLIIEYWDYIWSFSHVYEAVECCVTLTEKLTDKPLIRRKMRTFFINQSMQHSVINLTVEHFITKDQNFNRLLAYAELLRK